MINRDNDGFIVSVDSISDATKELSAIEKLLADSLDEKNNCISEEKKGIFTAKMKDLKDLVALVTPEMQKKAKPTELIGYLKVLMKIKAVGEKVKQFEESGEET